MLRSQLSSSVSNIFLTISLVLTGDVGADAVHPAPGAGEKPSFTALASSVDSMLAKYIASNGIQGGGREMIQDLQVMSKVGVRIIYRMVPCF